MSGDRQRAGRAFLLARIDYERSSSGAEALRSLKLDRMRELLAALGNPERHLRVFHIAGTKGKGSTAAMLAAMLTAAGHRTGLFTSPHLHQVEERLQIDAQACSSGDFLDLVDQVRPVVEQMDRASALGGPTYFEVTTAVALLHFVRQAAQAVVLEVGLGGRLDSTNVCLPEVTAITSISFDHMQQLGATLPAIAAEKAGIVKPGVPLVSGVRDPAAAAVIEAICQDRGSVCWRLDREFGYRYHAPRNLEIAENLASMDYWRARGADRHWQQGLGLALLGEHQAANAAVALTMAGLAVDQGWKIPAAACQVGLENVNWPARLEVVRRRPTVIIDAAHNGASIDVLVRTLDESFRVRRRILIFATTQDKEVEVMLARVLTAFDCVLLTRYRNNPRGVPVAELARLAAMIRVTPATTRGTERAARDTIKTRLPGAEGNGGTDRLAVVESWATPAEAWHRAFELAAPEDLVCVAGSVFIAAELRRLAVPA